MPIEFACESCSRLLRVPDGSQGAQCECPACKSILEIPDPNAIGMVSVADQQPESGQLQIACPKCQYSLVCDRKLLGTKGQCRNCSYIFVISENPGSIQTNQNAPSWIFVCPECNQLFEGDESMRGKRGKCHSCNHVFNIELQRSDTPETPAMVNQPAVESPKPAAKPSSETIRIACSSCRGVMDVPASAAGKTTACPFCQQRLQIPGSPSTPKPASPSAHTQDSAAPKSKPPKKRAASKPAKKQPTRPEPTQAPASTPQVPVSAFDDLGEIEDQLADPLSMPGGNDSVDWEGLDDLSGAAQPNAYAPVNVAGNWNAPVATITRGLTFSNVFKLVFDRAFPASFACALVYVLMFGAAGAIFYGSLFLTGMIMGAAEIRDLVTARTIIAVVAITAGIASMLIMNAGFCMMCNAALLGIRGKKIDSAELFSTANAFAPMLIYFFSIFVLSLVVGFAPQGIILLLGPQGQLVAALVGLVLGLVMMIINLAVFLTPFGILDGYSPIDAASLSVKIVASNPLTILGVAICASLLQMALGVATCGLGFLLLVGLPLFFMAAIYHLGQK